MKLKAFLITSAIVLAPCGMGAQAHSTGSRKPTVGTSHTASGSRAGCVKLPELSPKIPALPAGTPCAKSLYRLSTVPNVKFDYISPAEGPVLRETLGIESTSFSLDYIDIKEGKGELALPHKWYSIEYTGYLVNGTKFDSSAERGPFTFQYGDHQVIAGWDTGFAGMRVGGKRRLFIPYELAYGPQGHGMIPPKSMLIFDVELIAESDQKPVPKPQPAPSVHGIGSMSGEQEKPAAQPQQVPAKPAAEPAQGSSTAPGGSANPH